MNACTMYGDCAPTIWDWVLGNMLLTIITDIVLIAVAATLVTFLIRWLIRRRQPFCVDCLSNQRFTHTKYTYHGRPACADHYHEREMADEPSYECPKHHVPFNKQRHEGITIDVCPQGCVFLDDGELSELEDEAESSGRSSGQMLGIAIGSAL